jgi:hypothetical protein
MTNVVVLFSTAEESSGIIVPLADTAFVDLDTNTTMRELGPAEDVLSVVAQAAINAQKTGRRLLAAVAPDFEWQDEFGRLGAQVGKWTEERGGKWPVYELEAPVASSASLPAADGLEEDPRH